MRAIIIFARLPIPGKVKTRLAKSIGFAAACNFYRACAESIILETSKCADADRYLYFSEESDAEAVATWMASIGQADSMRLHVQAGGADVGSRMRNAFERVFSEGATEAAVVGTDIPDLSAAVIESAFEALTSHEVVFGPAHDGGYYLLAIKRLCSALFEGIPWSTDGVLDASLLAARRTGCAVAPSGRLPTLIDVDTGDDLELWLRRTGISTPPPAAPSGVAGNGPSTGGAGTTAAGDAAAAAGTPYRSADGGAAAAAAGTSSPGGGGGVRGKPRGLGPRMLSFNSLRRGLGAGGGGRPARERELLALACTILDEKHELEDALAETGYVLP